MQTAAHARALVLVCSVCLLGCGETAQSPISQGGQGAYEASLAALSDGFVVGWHDTRDEMPEIYARLLDADGRPSSREWRLTDNPHRSYEPDVAVVPDGFAVAWYEVTDTGSAVRVGVWSDDGTLRWEQTVSAAGGKGRNPVLIFHGQELFCAWLEHDGKEWAVWARWIGLEGQQLGSSSRIATAGETTWNLNAALDRDGYPWVVFDAAVADTNEELFAVRVEGEAAYLVRLTCQDGVVSKYPDVAFGPDRVAVTWLDEKDGNREVYLAAVPYEQVGEGIDQQATRVTRTPGESIGAYVAWNGEQIGLAWSDDTEGSHEIYFQRFFADGTPVHQPQRVTTNPTASLIPAIEAFRDGFALVWNEDVIEMRGSHAEGGRSEVAFAFVP